MPIVLVILAMKIPIFGLLWLIWWAGRAPEAEQPGEESVRGRKPLRPRPTLPGRPRRRGPHGGGAALPAPMRRRGETLGATALAEKRVLMRVDGRTGADDD